MDCPRCGFIEQRDVRCPRCNGSFNAEEAQEWSHLDFLEAKLGEWRDQGMLNDQKVEELLALTDRELATVEGILGIETDSDSVTAADPKSARAQGDNQILDAVDSALARGDTRRAERLLDSVGTTANAGGSDQPAADREEQFEPIETDISLDMLFLVTAELGAPPIGEYFRRAIVYAASPEEACQRVSSYIELCNEAAAARPSREESGESNEPQATLGTEADATEERSVENENENENEGEDENGDQSGQIAHTPDLMTATLVAPTTMQLTGENAFDADHILIFETLWNE